MRYFEEFITRVEDGQPKCLGMRILEGNPEGRTLGFYGRQELTLTAPLVLKKGHREVTVKASDKKPLRVHTMLHMVEGRRD